MPTLIIRCFIIYNQRKMEAQDSYQQRLTYYPFSSTSSHIDSLFKLRQKNDQILLEIIHLSNENEKLETNISRQKRKIPQFIYKWWNSNQSRQKMSIFLQKLNLALQQQIDSINRKLHEHKGEYELNEADYNQQINQTAELKNKVQELIQKLSQLRANNAHSSQIQHILTNTDGNQLRQHNALRSVLRSAVNENEILQKRINHRFSQNCYQNNEEQYYAQFQFIITSLFQRKRVIKGKLGEISHQIDQINKCISAEQRDRETKNELKKSIMKKRREIKSLNEKLQAIKEKKQEVKMKKLQLQEKYSQEEMDKIVPQINRQSRRSNELLARVIEILKDIGNKPNLQRISSQLNE